MPVWRRTWSLYVLLNQGRPPLEVVQFDQIYTYCLFAESPSAFLPGPRGTISLEAVSSPRELNASCTTCISHLALQGFRSEVACYWLKNPNRIVSHFIQSNPWPYLSRAQHALWRSVCWPVSLPYLWPFQANRCSFHWISAASFCRAHHGSWSEWTSSHTSPPPTSWEESIRCTQSWWTHPYCRIGPQGCWTSRWSIASQRWRSAQLPWTFYWRAAIAPPWSSLLSWWYAHEKERCFGGSSYRHPHHR